MTLPKPLLYRKKFKGVFNMATTAIWDVKGWLGKVVIYVENPDKTDNPKFFEKPDMTDAERQGLSDVLTYAANPAKTEQIEESGSVQKSFVDGINCLPSTARNEMLAVKKRFGKDGGIVAFHGYQSFAPGEATPEVAHEIGVKLAQVLWGDRFQVLVATHLDKSNHLHNHFVLNSVSFVDGLRYNDCTTTYMEMRKCSDRICREYNLSVIENPARGKSKQYGEWRAEQEQRPTWRGLIRQDVDEAIRAAMTETQFFSNLRSKGYDIKTGKDISVRPPGKERFVRLARNFGEDYTIEIIRKRILKQARPERPMPEPERKTKRYVIKGNLKTAKKITGFRALYFHYCFLLGVFQKDKPQNRKRLHFLLREDLAKMDAISDEVKLLCKYHIDTAEQLSLYKSGCETRLETVTADRKALYKKLRTKDVRASEDKTQAVKTEISGLSKQFYQLRKEVGLCDDIAIRSGIIKEKIKTVREDEVRKEFDRNEYIRRCSGTNRPYEP